MNPQLILECYTTITAIQQKEWDAIFAHRGMFDWQALKMHEGVFSSNEKEIENWEFYYYLVRDAQSEIIAATFFTCTIAREIMLPADNEITKSDHHIKIKVFSMGALTTNGDHLFIDQTNSQWKESLKMILEQAKKDQEVNNAGTFVLRDLKAGNHELFELLRSMGFAEVALEDNHVLDLEKIKDRESFIQSLTAKKRWHLKNDVLANESFFEVGIVEHPSEEQIDNWCRLYHDVKSKSAPADEYKLPRKLFAEMARSENWEKLELRLKPGPESEKPLTVAVSLSYKNVAYSHVLLGMDYRYMDEYKIYKQVLFRLILRAIELRSSKLCLGTTASVEKRKIGALAVPQVAFVYNGPFV